MHRENLCIGLYLFDINAIRTCFACQYICSVNMSVFNDIFHIVGIRIKYRWSELIASNQYIVIVNNIFIKSTTRISCCIVLDFRCYISYS